MQLLKTSKEKYLRKQNKDIFQDKQKQINMEHFIEEGDIPQEPYKRPPGRPKGSFKPKMNESQKRAFIKESITAVLDNHMSYNEYTQFCKDKDLSKSQANEYWLKVWSVIKKKFELEKDKLILKHTQKYWDIYQQAIEQRDLTNARGSLNDLAKLQGLAQPEKIEITGKTIKLNFGEPEE